MLKETTKREGRHYTQAYDEVPNTLSKSKGDRALELASITVETTDINGNAITLDGDVIRLKPDRPASAVLIGNTHAMMSDTDTQTWIDATNTPRTVNKAGLAVALAQIAQKTSEIWGKYV